jgi:putative transposase
VARYGEQFKVTAVKHGWVERVADWPYSSFHRHVRAGVYPVDWGGGIDVEGLFGERGG